MELARKDENALAQDVQTMGIPRDFGSQVVFIGKNQGDKAK
jgi:hypothetical protein